MPCFRARLLAGLKGQDTLPPYHCEPAPLAECLDFRGFCESGKKPARYVPRFQYTIVRRALDTDNMFSILV